MKKRSRGLRQLELVLPTWGGAREGAGRKRSGLRARVRHRTRPVRAGRLPVLVTIRLRPEWRGLREPALVQPLRDVIAAINARGRLRIVEYCLLDDHLHMLVEAADRTALAHGLQGFCARLAAVLHAHHARTGPILEDRYHARDLATPREVRSAVAYVLNNARHHVYPLLPGRRDPHSSAPWSTAFTDGRAETTDSAPTLPAATFLLAVAWHRHHLRIDVDEVPGPLHPSLRKKRR